MAGLIDRVRARPVTAALVVGLGGLAGAGAFAWIGGQKIQADVDARTRRRLGKPAHAIEPSAADIHVAPAQYGR